MNDDNTAGVNCRAGYATDYIYIMKSEISSSIFAKTTNTYMNRKFAANYIKDN